MMRVYRQKTEAALAEYAEGFDNAPILADSMRYGLLNGGKRIRPCLLLCTTDMLGGSVETALPFACALEMIHCYSLIHDDLPAMDNDDFRRGKPSTHKQFGEANAILAGDGLLTNAALLLAGCSGFDAAKRAILSGAMDMVGGQSRDLNQTERTEEELHLLHAQKTGALFRAALTAGAIVAGRDDLADTFAKLGNLIGLLFQITDDLLDRQKDLQENKFTYLTFYGEEKSRAFAAEAETEALRLLDPFQNDAAEALRTLIRGMTHRTE